jgi:hypothetical protein
MRKGHDAVHGPFSQTLATALEDYQLDVCDVRDYNILVDQMLIHAMAFARKLQNKGDFAGKGVANPLFIWEENFKCSFNNITIPIPTWFFTGEVAYYCLIPNYIPIKFPNQP